MVPALILLASVLLFRVAPWFAADQSVLKALAGISPLCAFALCAGGFLPKRSMAWAFALATVLIPHLLINTLRSGFPVFDWQVAGVLAVVAVVTAAGIRVGPRAPVATWLGLSLAGTVLFHLVTNTVSFLADPGYAKTFAGWWQCQTVGLPGFPPTWVFTARQLAGDLLFTGLFVLAFRSRPASVQAGSPVIPPSVPLFPSFAESRQTTGSPVPPL